MKRNVFLLGAACCAALTVSAATRYVDLNNTAPAAPFTNWTSAATNIQDAVDAAMAGDDVLVTNGVYETGTQAVYGMSNRVAVTKPIAVRSVNGSAMTSIVGSGPNGDTAVRCVYLTNGALLAGFTLTNGSTQVSGDFYTSQSGGGVWCESSSAVLSNCTLTGNSASSFGGGAYSGTLYNCILTSNSSYYGGGARSCSLYNCTLSFNSGSSPFSEGGGVYSCTLDSCALRGNSANRGGGAFSCTMNNCTLTANSATGQAAEGGGSYSGTLSNCTLTGNSAGQGGGASFGTLNNCILTNNFAGRGGGASQASLDKCIVTRNSSGDTGGGVHSSTLTSCALTSNTAPEAGGGAYLGTLNNCTLVGNSAGCLGGGALFATLNNCIIYYNTGVYCGDAPGRNYYAGTLNHCCTTPLPAGAGNFTNAPQFMDTNGWSNLRLQVSSPCINAGNNAYIAGLTDLDGSPRISGGTVDLGAYEVESPASIISYAWLQQYGLLSDGSADDADSDHDGLTNWQEWVAGTDPTNSTSALQMLSVTAAGSGVTVTWSSVANRSYALEWATDLGAASTFSVLQNNIAGLVGTNSWTDTNAAGSAPRFYRVRVEN